MELEEMVEKLWEDMYMGRGPQDPPITVRMDRVEKTAETFNRAANKIILAAGSAIIALIVDVVKNWASHH